MSNDLEDVEKGLETGLDDLVVKLEGRFAHLTKLANPLQRPFEGESLSVPSISNVEQPREVLLQDRISDFRKVRQQKEAILCKLWEDWEEIQFQLVSLTTEVLGRDQVVFGQTNDEDLKPGQKEKLHTVLESAQHTHDEKGNPHESLGQDLESFQENIDQLSQNVKKTATEMQQVSYGSFSNDPIADFFVQQYKVQKHKLFKGLHRHIELLAAL